MKKLMLAALGAVAAILLAFTLIPMPSHAGGYLELWYQPGGNVLEKINGANQWKRQGVTVVIRDMQVSADGLAILHGKRIGVPMCHGKKGFNASPVLKLHQSRLDSRNVSEHAMPCAAAKKKFIATYGSISKVQNGRSRWVYIDHAACYGFPSPVHGYRTVSMAQVGIKACPPYKATKKVTPAPEVWYPRARRYNRGSPWR